MAQYTYTYHISYKKRGAKAPEERQLESAVPISRDFIIHLFDLDSPTVEEFSIRQEDLPLCYGRKKRQH